MSEQLLIKVYRAEDLLVPEFDQTLSHINQLINDSYDPSHRGQQKKLPIDSNAQLLFPQHRISSKGQLALELGKQGLVAICLDESLPASSKDNAKAHDLQDFEHIERYGKVVAVASVKPWTTKGVLLFARSKAQQANSDGHAINDVELARLTKDLAAEMSYSPLTWNWEISTCATADTARYRGKGLMMKCVDSLTKGINQRHVELKKSGDPKGDMPIQLWVAARVGSTTPDYWRRRGFVNEGPPDVAPKGMWASTKDFQIQTLRKLIT